MPVDPRQVTSLIDRIEKTLGTDLKVYPGGYPEHLGLALTDAVLSIRARYGDSPTTGVRAAVSKLRGAHNEAANDLAALATIDPDALADEIGNHQRSGGRLKAQCIVDAAGALSDVGVRTAEDYRSTADESARKRAYLGVKGLGPQTYAYLGMLVGVEGVKADVWVQRYVEAATGTAPSSTEAQALVTAAAAQLAINTTHLDHAIWAYQRRAESDSVTDVEADAEGVADE